MISGGSTPVFTQHDFIFDHCIPDARSLSETNQATIARQPFRSCEANRDQPEIYLYVLLEVYPKLRSEIF
jgi:hypothetical protein